MNALLDAKPTEPVRLGIAALMPRQPGSWAMRVLGTDHVGILEDKGPRGGLRAGFSRVGGTGAEILEARVPDIAAAEREPRAAGRAVIGETPRPGARGSKIADARLKPAGGILVHLAERPDRG